MIRLTTTQMIYRNVKDVMQCSNECKFGRSQRVWQHLFFCKSLSQQRIQALPTCTRYLQCFVLLKLQLKYKMGMVYFVLGMTLNCIHLPPQGTNNIPVPVLSPDRGGRFARSVAIRWQSTKTIEIRKNHSTSDKATQMLQGVMMWSRYAQAGQDRLVVRVGGEGKGHIRDTQVVLRAFSPTFFSTRQGGSAASRC